MNRLPIELLLQVLCPPTGPPPIGGTTSLRDLKRVAVNQDSVTHYFAVRQVCRHWRHVLAFPSSLWSTVILHSRGRQRRRNELIEYFLSRSGVHLLNVHSDSFAELEAVAEQSHRLQHLHVSSRESWGVKINHALEKFRFPAPHLEWLECNADEPIEDDVPLPLMFAGQTPRLQRLKLCRIPSWGTNQFCNLTHLCIKGWEYDESGSIRFQELLELLRQNSSSLQEVHLSYLDPWIDPLDEPVGALVSDQEKIKLSGLKRLRLNSLVIPQLISILTFLCLPHGSALAVTSIRDDNEETNVFDMFSGRLPQYENLSDIRTLTINDGARARGCGSSGSLYVDTVEREPLLGFYNLSHLPFAQVLSELWITDDDCPVEEIDWFSFFASLPVLCKLGLRHVSTRPILCALSRTSSPPRFMEFQVLCKSLTSLCLCWDPDMFPDKPNSSYYDLHHCVETRHRNGHPIHDIRIIPHDDLDRWPSRLLVGLRQYVTTVELKTRSEGFSMQVPLESDERVDPKNWPGWGNGTR